MSIDNEERLRLFVKLVNNLIKIHYIKSKEYQKVNI